MNRTLAHLKPVQSQATHTFLHCIPHTLDTLDISGDPEKINSDPKVFIKGDIRLRVTESYAALRPVKGRYQIETERMQEPLHVLWIIEGNVLSHTVHCIEVTFDMRGTPAGETVTRQLTAQVTERGGQGGIVHSSVFVQIFVANDELTHDRSQPLHLRQVAVEQ